MKVNEIMCEVYQKYKGCSTYGLIIRNFERASLYFCCC